MATKTGIDYVNGYRPGVFIKIKHPMALLPLSFVVLQAIKP
ncbi:hypothetical protein [Ruminiclostridium cellobioparum]|jgi:hypothetical protein|nr:hypothetical protein [Ruminiclostridium cellobioparum]